MSYGTGPYGTAPFGGVVPTNNPEGIAALSSSRGYDGVTRRYVIATDGGFAPMDDVAQRVLLLLAFGVPAQRIITPQDNAASAANIRRALEPLTRGSQPTIRIVELVVTDGGGGRLSRSLTYKNLLAGTQQTITPDGRLVSNP